MTNKGLTPRQRRFVEEYLVDLNGRQAAMRAGYKESTAVHQAARMLAFRKVADAVEAGMMERSARTKVDQDRVVGELAKLAFVDIRRLLNAEGGLRPICEIDGDTAAAVISLNIDEIIDGGAVAGVSKKVRLADKLRALELLGKHLGLFSDRLKIQGDAENPIAVLIRQVQGNALPVVADPVDDEDDDDAV